MQVPYFTGTQLKAAARDGIKRGFNRQLDPVFVRDLDPDLNYPITYSMLHEHIAGKLVEPHMRVMVVWNERGDTVTFDVELGAYLALDKNEFTDREVAEEMEGAANG